MSVHLDQSEHERYGCALGIDDEGECFRHADLPYFRRRWRETTERRADWQSIGYLANWFTYMAWVSTLYTYCPDCGKRIDWDAIERENP
ncbi:MAG: hypothetical protein ABIH03_05920 [Pseudomonadota bacterium]